jgi:hypothetical protein
MSIDPRITSRVLVGVILVVFAVAIARTNVLNDPSDAVRKPYSFSRTQLAWWTLIIACSYLAYWGTFGFDKMPDLNGSCLILLGIGVGTTAIAKGLDASQDAANPHRHQDNESQGFVIDILSDSTGVSMHRLQAVVFNLIYGTVFLSEVILTVSAAGAEVKPFPDFKEYSLGLMGISSAAYLYMKSQENQTAAAPAPATAQPAAVPADASVQTGDPIVG